jgi:hypothetical protein
VARGSPTIGDRGGKVAVKRVQPVNANFPRTTVPTPPEGRRSGVLIIGVRRDAIFVPTEVLISADALGDEQAIRAWLATDDIQVAPSNSTEVIGSSGPAGANPDEG